MIQPVAARARGGIVVSHPEAAVAVRDFGLLLQLSGATLADVYEARASVEPVAVALMASRRDDGGVDELKAAAGSLAIPVNEGTQDVYPGGARFHTGTFGTKVLCRDRRTTPARQFVE